MYIWPTGWGTGVKAETGDLKDRRRGTNSARGPSETPTQTKGTTKRNKKPPEGTKGWVGTGTMSSTVALVLTLNLKKAFVGTWCSLFTSVLVSAQKIFSDCWNHLQHLQQGHKLGESKLWCQWCRQGQTTTKPPNHISITEILLLHSFPIVPIAGTSIENRETFGGFSILQRDFFSSTEIPSWTNGQPANILKNPTPTQAFSRLVP